MKVSMIRWMALWVAILALGCGGPDGSPPAGSGGDPGASGAGAGTGPTGGASPSGGQTAGGQGGQSGGSAGAESGGTGTGGAEQGGAATGGDAGQGGEPEGGEAGDQGEGGEPGIVERVESVPADKIDLLFVIDNSISMDDKQAILGDAVPLLVERLVTPACVDAAGNPTGGLSDPDGQCAAGEPEFPPIRDIHIAIISSSLGASGGDLCIEEGDNDGAHLIPTVRDGLASWNDSGFLAWDPDGDRNDPPGESSASALVSGFQDMVVAVGEEGCGFEATLEAWYRFLVDPDPPSAVARDTGTNLSVAEYPDETVLAQREAFLRPDSLVGIVVLTDENDCSIIDHGQGWLVGTSLLNNASFHMPRATSVCADDPNDPCCVSCNTGSPPAGCDDLGSDANCALGSYDVMGDSLNLRCFDQKRRFGVDFLFPIQRYLDGLTATLVPDREGGFVPNPLFASASGNPGRDGSHVFLVGIVGVPWQDVADEDSLSDPMRLRYLSFDELDEQDRWSLILGENGEPPGDGLMLETPVDRSTLGLGPHPLTGDPIAPSTSEDPQENPINGHESAITDNYNDDLQYACIFPLEVPRDCSDALVSCDCVESALPYNRPLCQPPGGGAASTTQHYAKAYPGGRHLELLRAFGELTGNAVVASICPKVLDSSMPSSDPAYGYNPAMTAMVDRMKSALAPACLADALEVDADGLALCSVMEVVLPPSGGSCEPCGGDGRMDPDPDRSEALLGDLESSRFCGDTGQPACDELCVCELSQLEGSELEQCQTEPAVDASLSGYCYIDAEAGLGNPDLTDYCPVGRKRRLRFVGENVPQGGARTFVLCE